MRIEIKDDTQKLVISTEELNNLNYVDLGFYDEEAVDEFNKTGFLYEITVPIDELKAGVDAFMQVKKDNEEREKSYE